MEENKKSDANLSAKVLAAIFNVSERRLEQLAKLGMPKTDTKLFPLIAATKWYIIYLKGLSEKEKKEKEQQKELLVAAKIKRVQLENARLESKSVDLEDVRQSVMSILQILKTNLLTIPGRLAPQLEGKKDAAEIKSIISSEMENILIKLAKDFEDAANANNLV